MTTENKRRSVHVHKGVDFFAFIRCHGSLGGTLVGINIRAEKSTPIFIPPTDVHIGSEIKKELEKQERTITWFASHLNCERTNVYSIFRRESIDTNLLMRISRILRRNFLAELGEEMETDVKNIQHKCDF